MTRYEIEQLKIAADAIDTARMALANVLHTQTPKPELLSIDNTLIAASDDLLVVLENA